MRKQLFGLFILLALFTQSCAFHYGNMTDSASISQPNFRIVETGLQGTSSTLKVFGFGGLARNSIVADAKRDLLAHYRLKENQTLANVSVDFKNSFILFVQTQRCTVTADIVEFR